MPFNLNKSTAASAASPKLPPLSAALEDSIEEMRANFGDPEWETSRGAQAIEKIQNALAELPPGQQSNLVVTKVMAQLSDVGARSATSELSAAASVVTGVKTNKLLQRVLSSWAGETARSISPDQAYINAMAKVSQVAKSLEGTPTGFKSGLSYGTPGPG